jgi:hypothetical protein
MRLCWGLVVPLLRDHREANPLMGVVEKLLVVTQSPHALGIVAAGVSEPAGMVRYRPERDFEGLTTLHCPVAPCSG